MHRRQFLRAAGCAIPAVGALPATASATQSAFEPLGSVSITGATEAVVGPESETAYVATQDGFAVVDISTPNEPAVLQRRTGLLSEREGGPMQEILDVKVAGDRLLVAGPANGHEEPVVEGFLLYDVTDPKDPERVAFHETEFPIHNAELTEERAYLVNGSEVVLVGVADEPTELGRWAPRDADPAWAEVDGLLRFAHDVYAQGDRAYVVEWDAGTFVLDVSDPAAPTVVTRIGGRSAETLAEIPSEDAVVHSLSMPGNHHTAAVNDDASLLALNKEAWPTELTEGTEIQPLGEVELWDVREETAPERLATIEAPHSRNPEKAEINTTPHNFEIRGERLYSSWYDGGVKIHDVSDPRNPELLAWWRDPHEWTFWTAQYATEEFFVASSHSRGRYNAGKGALVTFPNRAGEQASPPALTDTETPTPTVEPTPSSTPGTSTPSSPAPTSTPAAESKTVSAPGFGLLGAAGAISLATWRHLRD
ncbi:LVIVD repeat-containing protein [Halolamina sediminis]|uniref:LVIVD repeat-containing protein n=1 Tax=Halolamina sediminis TaxID=1480675 RepID=UPI0006B511AA|nr:hypothetical protein [Halolamina sediminis]